MLRAKATTADLLGARLVSINGRSVDELRALARSLAGGVPAWRDRNANYLFESPEQLAALGAIDGADSATYRFEATDGRVIERTLIAEPANPHRPRANSDRWLYPALLAEEGDDWRTLLAPEHAPCG